MKAIRLNQPVSMSPALERLRLVPGRHLGEDELDRMQAYADERVAPLLASARPGILRGLQVDLPPQRPNIAGVTGEGLVVRPGLAVSGDGSTLGLFYEARATWRALLEGWLRENNTDQGEGVYYLVVRRRTGLIDSDHGIDPCRRIELDPRRDTRLETLGTLGLRRQALAPAAIAGMTPEQIQNQVAAINSTGSFLDTMTSAVPLALLAVSRLEPAPAGLDAFPFRVDWVSQEAGRYLAIEHTGYQVLLAQVQTAFRDALERAMSQPPAVPAGDDRPTLGQRLELSLRLDFLPAAGVLPGVLLERADAPTPTLRWLPRHLAVEMVPVPEESVPELIERHLARRVMDLRRPMGDRLRLLLAVNEPDYRPDLLDFPRIDALLVRDLYRYHIRAHEAWREWRQAFDRLYYLLTDDLITVAERRVLDLPRSVLAPILPGAFYARLVTQARSNLPPIDGELPYPYRDFLESVPAAPAFYDPDWLVNGAPPAVATPREDGLVIRYRVAQVEMGRVDNQVRALRARLEKTRDYLLLQRQQLDAQTVALAALGGGVAGDGSGLQVARWLPFTQLKMAAPVVPAQSSARSFAVGGQEARTFTSSASIPTFKLAAGGTTAVFPELTGSTKGPSDIPVGSAAVKGSSASSLVARARASSVEINLQRDKLDRIAEIPKQTISEPAIAGRSYKFGVLDHIQAEVKEYEAAYRGMRDLIATLDSMFPGPEADALRTALDGFGIPVTPNSLAAEQAQRDYPLGVNDLARVRTLRDRLSGADDRGKRDALDNLLTDYSQLLVTLEVAEGTLEGDAEADTKRRFEALFQAGQILTRQIAYMEDRYNRLEDQLEDKLRERLRLEAVLDKLAALIEVARQKLDGVDARRAERLGDYGLAQGLSREDWERVYRANLERSRILTTALKGIYYVRVRETPVGYPLVDPLELRHGSAGDLVPGCDWDTEVDVPEELGDFFDTVLEVPMGDWRILAPLAPKLPEPRIPELLDMRRYRFLRYRARPQFTPGSSRLAARLAPLVSATGALHQTWANLTPASGGRLRGPFLKDSARVLSLKDLLGGSAGTIQVTAQTLRNRLEQCVQCLVGRLNQVAPSLRFEWAQLAEDDRLNTERPDAWPGLERAEAADFNAVRTLTEVVAWWFRQLEPDASASGRSALRNMIRASVIISAHGDPNEILQGRVQVPPRRLAVGEPLRLELNRIPKAGVRLQIMDEAQRIVGLLAVQDQDQTGTLAQVVRVDEPLARISTRYTVLSVTRSLSVSQ